MKKDPLESSLEFSDSLNYENTIDHVLVWARKIHKLVLYQAFFFLFFELAKNEDGPEFAFLDSLNPKYQSIKFIVVSPISHNQMDLSE